MSIDPIERLLKDADGRAGSPPAGPADLAVRVRRRAHRRRVARSVAAAGCVLLAAVLAAALVFLRGPRPTKENVPPAAVADAAALQREIDAREAALGRLVLRERLRRANARIEALAANPDAMARLNALDERAAESMVRYAAALERLDKPGPAIEAYCEVDALFPETCWADVARERIRRLKPS